MSHEFGEDEGAICWRDGCQGLISVAKVEDCSCHIAPPCGNCLEPRQYCPACDWRAQDDKQVTFKHLGGGIIEMLKGPQPRPLDPRKIDFRLSMHTGASQICEGVYPDGVTMKDVEAVVKGTFGGRFDAFKNGRFKYIAYTD